MRGRDTEIRWRDLSISLYRAQWLVWGWYLRGHNVVQDKVMVRQGYAFTYLGAIRGLQRDLKYGPPDQEARHQRSH